MHFRALMGRRWFKITAPLMAGLLIATSVFFWGLRLEGGWISFKISQVSAATEYLIPDANGNYTEMSIIGGGGYYDSIDDPQGNPDDESTYLYIYQSGASPETERVSVTFPDTVGSGTIDSVTVHFRLQNDGDSNAQKGTPFFRISSTDYEGTEVTPPVDYSWNDFNEVFTENPATSSAFTWTELDTIEVGIKLYSNEGREGDFIDVTQLYLEITSSAASGGSFVRATEGTVVSDTLTLNIEVSSGSDRVLVVGVAYKSNSPLTPTTIVFNTSENFSVELTAADGGDAQCFMYYLAAPTETTADVVITMPSEVRMVGYVAYFTGIHQSEPFTASTNEAQGTDAAPTVDVSSAADEIVLDIMAQVSAGPDTATASHTQVCNGAATGGGSDTRGAGQYITGSTTTTMDWSMSDSDNWNIIGGALQESSGAAPNISNTPATYNFGTVGVSSTTNTGLAYFTVTNNSGAAVDISIKGTDMTGGTAWTLSDTATPGVNILGINAGLSGGSYNIIVKKNSPYNNLVSGLADAGDQDWGLQLLAPTEFGDGVAKQGTVILSAVLS